MQTETEIRHIHEDLEVLKMDLAVIKYILSEEGQLTESAKKRLAEARKTPRNEYIPHDQLMRKLLK